MNYQCDCEGAGTCWGCSMDRQVREALSWFSGALKADISNEDRSHGRFLAEEVQRLQTKLDNRNREVADLRKAGEALWKLAKGESKEVQDAMTRWSDAYLSATK